MNLFNPIKISIKNLLATKLRSVLSILGIVIGVASVIIIFAIGKSAQNLILEKVEGIGSNLVVVLPGASEEDGPPAQAFGISVTTLKYEDLRALLDQRKVPGILAGAGYVRGNAIAETYKSRKGFSFVGVTASYTQVENSQVVKGRFFTEGEERGMARVAVIGSNAVVDLFGDQDPINQKVEIKGHNFTVIGVFKERGSNAFGTNQDDSIFVPLLSAQKLLLGIDYLNFIRLSVESSDKVPFAMESIRTTLREQHDIEDSIDDDFSVRSQEAALKTLTNVTDVLRYFLLAIGSISLLVGGVGIMNIMLISVNQRVREIGLRKAVGAKGNDVLSQFLIESVTVSLMGGVFGVLLGISVSFLASLVIVKLGYNWEFLISIRSLLLAVFVCILIGVIFGIYPARKASRISPMEALRYE